MYKVWISLDKKFNYDLLDLEDLLEERLGMTVQSPSKNDYLDYDVCEIKLKNNELKIKMGFLCGNNKGYYFTSLNSKVLEVIEDWTEEIFNKGDIENEKNN